METKELIQKIVNSEWEMFHNVNGEERADCQDDPETFYAMRNAQYSVWSPELLESYLKDLQQAEAEGRNLLREKYIRMMKSTDSESYELFSGELPDVSPEKDNLVREIWSHMLAQTERLRVKYPMLALGGRPLRTEEEEGWPSIETYQTCELKTYSEKTLALFLRHLTALEKEGVDLVYRIQENSVTCMGYATMDDGERALTNQFIEMMKASGEFGNCCCGETD